MPDIRNGNGSADYLITGFDLSSVALGDRLLFRAEWSGASDGGELFSSCRSWLRPRCRNRPASVFSAPRWPFWRCLLVASQRPPGRGKLRRYYPSGLTASAVCTPAPRRRTRPVVLGRRIPKSILGPLSPCGKPGQVWIARSSEAGQAPPSRLQQHRQACPARLPPVMVIAVAGVVETAWLERARPRLARCLAAV